MDKFDCMFIFLIILFNFFCFYSNTLKYIYCYVHLSRFLQYLQLTCYKGSFELLSYFISRYNSCKFHSSQTVYVILFIKTVKQQLFNSKQQHIDLCISDAISDFIYVYYYDLRFRKYLMVCCVFCHPTDHQINSQKDGRQAYLHQQIC